MGIDATSESPCNVIGVTTKNRNTILMRAPRFGKGGGGGGYVSFHGCYTDGCGIKR